jgi:hypothetical protein
MVPERIRAERKDVGVGVAAAGLLPVVLVMPAVVVEAASDAEALDSEKTLSGEAGFLFIRGTENSRPP